MDKNIICNHKQCQMVLTSTAWISSCSHIFCDEHSQVYETDKKCSLCCSNLNGKYDLIHKNLNPSEKAKSIMLAGLSPTNILEIGSKALAFWNFQMFQERMYLTSLVKQLRGQLARTESSNENISETLKDLVQQESLKCKNLEKELQNCMMKAKDLQEKVEMKSRELINIHLKYEALQKQMVHIIRSNNLVLNQNSATGAFYEPMSQALHSTKYGEPVKQTLSSVRQRNTCAPPPPKAFHTAQGSLQENPTPQIKINKQHDKHHVFCYPHLPSEPSKSGFNFNPVISNQHLHNRTPRRQSQIQQLFLS